MPDLDPDTGYPPGIQVCPARCDHGSVLCAGCLGEKVVRSYRWMRGAEDEYCSACAGTGAMPCDRCGGGGYVYDQETPDAL